MNRPVIFISALLLGFTACRKDDPVSPTPTGPVTQREINTWMLDSMRYFYLWNANLPSTADTSLSASDFFASLKNTGDRFSYLYKLSDRSTYPKYMLYQYGIIFSISTYLDVPTGVIELVTPGSVADNSGLKRGAYFTAINGTTITATNGAALTTTMLAATSATLTTANGDVTLPAQNLPEDPIYKQSITTVNGKVTGYLFYNYFNDGFSNDLLQAFQSFKAAGVSELVLDLRYNPGGSVAAAAMLNAMIAPNITEETVFAKYTGNSRLGTRSISYKSALSVPETGKAVAFASLPRLSLSRVFILSGNATASAAELTINSLKPYTQVIQIGETTYGKDKAAVIISDTRSPQRVPWTLMPITYNLLNANGTGGYTQGITPDYVIDELSEPLTPLGDNTDPLIAKAFAIISGNTRQPSTNAIVKPHYNSQLQASDHEIVRWPVSLSR
jgi:C-terminal processing protease CtpA/Prc